ncbi:MAG TPA: transketolase [Longimicrobiales bacterium]|nr:transketolase [Longimicrobiales bacterium]
MTSDDGSVESRSVNVIRGLAMDAVEQANSGHPGLPMGAAAVAYTVWTRHLRHDPSDPAWPDRDRFVLSAGHGSMLLYALLHLSGYDLPLSELKNFRQWGSRTPGHPEHGLTPGVETTTGPLGQGFGNAVGMALAERWMAATWNRPGHELFGHRTYVLASDGDLMEGVQSEAASLAGHLGLGGLVVLYDANRISIDGSTDLTFTEDVGKRYEAYDWHVQHVEDGNSVEAVDAALRAAAGDAERPSLIVVRTQIGFGSPNRQDTAAAHGAPLGAAEVRLAKATLGLPEDETFWIPADVREHMDARTAGRSLTDEWRRRHAAWSAAFPDLAPELDRSLRNELPPDWRDALPTFEPGKKMATRKASGTTIAAIAGRIPNLIGGSADLAASNNTGFEDDPAIGKGQYGARKIHFGVREHAMGAMLNGMSLHGGIRPFGGTFLIFSDYMRPTIRLAALMHQPVTYIFTHDSIGLGEDGPTHQPIEQLMSLRLIPNMDVIRPADAAETAIAWAMAMERRSGPTALILTRQGLPVLDRSEGSGLAAANGAERGGYVLAEAMRGGTAVEPDVVLIGTGSEVHVCLEARDGLAKGDVAACVVSMPSLTRFNEQPQAYRDQVLPPELLARVVVEAGATLGWESVAGPAGEIIGIDRFGASAPGGVVMRELGFTAENAMARARASIERAAGIDVRVKV